MYEDRPHQPREWWVAYGRSEVKCYRRKDTKIVGISVFPDILSLGTSIQWEIRRVVLVVDLERYHINAYGSRLLIFSSIACGSRDIIMGSEDMSVLVAC